MKKILLTLAIAGMTSFGAFAGTHHHHGCKKNHCTKACCMGGKTMLKHGKTATDNSKTIKKSAK